MMAAERTREIPSIDNRPELVEFMLPRIFQDSNDVVVMNQITMWISGKVRET